MLNNDYSKLRICACSGEIAARERDKGGYGRVFQALIKDFFADEAGASQEDDFHVALMVVSGGVEQERAP
jgi:hypothetical protein